MHESHQGLLSDDDACEHNTHQLVWQILKRPVLYVCIVMGNLQGLPKIAQLS